MHEELKYHDEALFLSGELVSHVLLMVHARLLSECGLGHWKVIWGRLWWCLASKAGDVDVFDSRATFFRLGVQEREERLQFMKRGESQRMKARRKRLCMEEPIGESQRPARGPTVGTRIGDDVLPELWRDAGDVWHSGIQQDEGVGVRRLARCESSYKTSWQVEFDGGTPCSTSRRHAFSHSSA